MSKCKLTQSVEGVACDYEIAGAQSLYLANWYEPVTAETPEAAKSTPGHIVYHFDADGYLDTVTFPVDEKLYAVGAAAGTLNFTDALTTGGNGAKHRTHTINVVHPTTSAEVKQSADCLSLGRFVGFVLDRGGRVHCLGREFGLTATQFDYATGSAEADATGWTGVWATAAREAAPSVKGMEVISASIDKTVVLA